MSMQATPCDGTRQQPLIRKFRFVVQYRRGAGLPAHGA